MDRRSRLQVPLPPPRSTVPTLPGIPPPEPEAPARPATPAAELDAPGDAAGEEWWSSLRPLPLGDKTAEQARAADFATPDRASASEPVPRDTPSSLVPPPALTTEIAEPAPSSQRWWLPALVVAGALAMVLAAYVSRGSADEVSGLTLVDQAARPSLMIAELPSPDGSAELGRLGLLARAQIERASLDPDASRTLLAVRSTRPCTEIWVDARPRGPGLGRVYVVEPGGHAVACRLRSGQMLMRQLVVAEGQTGAVLLSP